TASYTPLNEADRSRSGKDTIAARSSEVSLPRRHREFIVAIDAGHGGKDVGAIGPNGTLEKDVVYAIARRLADMVRAEPGMRPLMVRKGDHFVGLHRRAEIARNGGADLFISLHADADDNEAAKGSSVFTLSPHGGESVKASDRAASKVLKEMRKKQPVHHREVQKARFAVLKSPDVPSMLIETGFVSNPGEEKNLASRAYQDRVARSIFRGIQAYFARQNPAPSRLAESKPVVLASRQ
ncbi:MAG: N-acetylmuramoyl-L-alanine amidase, partial [Methylococcaceae bacterium]|nr:N-acetylmuramoyl-L-alanine amidase [Methylococcaceae bacterium]